MKLPVFDLHCDTALALSERAEVYTALRSNHRHVDLVRAGELGGYCQCFAIYTFPKFAEFFGRPVTEVFEAMVSNLLEELAEKYPQYGFEIHKGYGTKAHYAALTEHGMCDAHRRSFLRKFYGEK